MNGAHWNHQPFVRIINGLLIFVSLCDLRHGMENWNGQNASYSPHRIQEWHKKWANAIDHTTSTVPTPSLHPNFKLSHGDFHLSNTIHFISIHSKNLLSALVVYWNKVKGVSIATTLKNDHERNWTDTWKNSLNQNKWKFTEIMKILVKVCILIQLNYFHYFHDNL